MDKPVITDAMVDAMFDHITPHDVLNGDFDAMRAALSAAFALVEVPAKPASVVVMPQRYDTAGNQMYNDSIGTWIRYDDMLAALTAAGIAWKE